MEWNIHSDKLILEFLPNCTPPSCILVIIIYMAMATNPKSEVAKMIPCIKYINNMRSDFPLLTKLLAGKSIGNSVQVNHDTLMQQATREQKLCMSF